MFFRNVVMFRFPTSVDFSEIATLLPHSVLKPVGALEMHSRGFVSPYGREETEVLHAQQGRFIWLAVGTEDKMLPAAVINDKVAERIEQIEASENRKPGGRERKRIKDDLIHELLPTAFVKRGRTDVLIDTVAGVVFVNTSSRKTGENVISDVRGLLGSFPAMPLNAEIAPRTILTSWIAGEPMPDGFELGEECELKDPMEGGAVAKCQYQELRCAEIDKHLDAGKQVAKLAIIVEDNLSLVLGDDLIIRKLKFLDGALDKLEDIDGEGRRAELDARFALQTGELSRLFDKLEDSFNLTASGDETELERANRKRKQTTIDAAPTTSPETIRAAGIEDAAKRAAEVDYSDDPLYPQAVKIVRETGNAGVSGLQRRLKIGYNHAACLIEAMEPAGIVSVADPATGARTVLQAEEV